MRADSSSSSSNTKRSRWIFSLVFLFVAVPLFLQVKKLSDFDLGSWAPGEYSDYLPSSSTTQQRPHSINGYNNVTESTALEELPHPHQVNATQNPAKKNATIIAYTVAVTSCDKPNSPSFHGLMDGAAVLQHSIHLNSIQNPTSKSKYDYHMIAITHADLQEEPCVEHLARIGYEIQVMPVPVRLDEIRNPNYAKIIENSGCCGEREFLKLYGYNMTQYPIVVQLDLDTVILKPFDDLFDVMLLVTQPTYSLPPAAMWNQTIHHPIDAFFTRDYNSQTKFPPHQMLPAEKIHIQGGFLVLRPNPSVLEEFLELIRIGDFVPFRGWSKDGWGGVRKGSGGSDRFQGIVSYYYSGLHPNTAVELNPCHYNQNAGSPWNKYNNKKNIPQEYKQHSRWCTKTGLPDEANSAQPCEDCRKTPLEEIYSVHFGGCRKPWECAFGAGGKKTPKTWKQKADACQRLHHAWHGIRFDLESRRQSLGHSSNASKVVLDYSDHRLVQDSSKNITLYYYGHCRENSGMEFGYEYLPLTTQS